MAKTERSATQAKLESLTFGLAVIQGLCAIAFIVDVGMEFPNPWSWHLLSAEGLVHLLSETTLIVLMVIGFAIARRTHLDLVRQRNALRQTLHALQQDFDSILHARLDTWNLTTAQRDVALLCIRGLRIVEIAQLRGSAEGTIKAHMSAIFRAAGVRTRSELIAMFMDDFLDFGAAPTTGRVTRPDNPS